MNPKRIWANFTVEDLERTTNFYKALGFTSNGRSDELTSFLFGDNGFVIHFFLKSVMEKNLKLPLADAAQASEIVFTISAETKEQVDEWSTQVEKAGGTLITPPEVFGKDYYGFLFADPDGHKFNVFFM
ncbi:VOC family protein [Niabella terrae]